MQATYSYQCGKQEAATHVLLDEVQATVHRHESCDLLAVLDQLHTGALTNSRVGLLGLNTTATHRILRHTEYSIPL